MKIYTYLVNIEDDIIEVNVYCNNRICGMSFIVDIYGDVDIEFISDNKTTLSPLDWEISHDQITF